MTGTADDIGPGTIPCPFCRAPIALPITSVLAGLPIRCSACDAELTADRSQSADALDKLGKWYAETQAARDIKRAIKSSGSGSG